MEWMKELQKKGHLIHAQPLGRSGMQISGSAKSVIEGPFKEGEEMVGGYLICTTENYDAAVEIAKGCPVLQFNDGNVEIREIREMEM